MINAEKRKVVWVLFREGKTKKEIARLLGIDPKTVRQIIKSHGVLPESSRKDKVHIDPTLLENVYRQCKGWGQRTYEVLVEEYGIDIGYSTLTRLIREMELNQPPNSRCVEVEVKPGAEMQHDTSPYDLVIGGKLTRVQCSGLYFRYSKIRYIKFYLSFNRFAMKSFFYEALMYLKYAAEICVIDNTNLAVLHGTGKNAVFVPEMNSFAKQFSFSWLAHEVNHPDRKGGKERNFHTVESNFIPGRTFRNLTDLNLQAFEWASNRYARRPHDRTKLIPIETFEIEKPYLNPIPAYVEPPMVEYDRYIDKYGYVSVHGNYYWIPGVKRETVKVVEKPGKIQVYKDRKLLIEHVMAAADIKEEKIKPPGVNVPQKPCNQKQTSQEEETKLRAAGEIVGQYLDFIKSAEGGVKQRHSFIKNLYGLFIRTAPSVFSLTIERAISYKINSIESLERMATQLMRTEAQDWPTTTSHGTYQDRPAYHEGRFSDEPDLFNYQSLLNPKKGEPSNDDK